MDSAAMEVGDRNIPGCTTGGFVIVKLARPHFVEPALARSRGIHQRGGRFDSDLGRYAAFDEVISLVAKPKPKIQRATSWKLNRFYSTVE
jgi:hypothetical protein